jgi:hypothetical protein
MTTPQSTASELPSPPSPPPPLIPISRAEFYWLALAVWVGGIFILALMPVLLIPRIGMPWGVIGSYLLFFVVWQPIQTITQRTLGMRAGFVRMVLFVAAAAAIAFYLRQAMGIVAN